MKIKKFRPRYYHKIILFGAGHPQIPFEYFAIKGKKKRCEEFFDEHETTHASFNKISYKQLPSYLKSDIRLIHTYNL